VTGGVLGARSAITRYRKCRRGW